MLTVGMIGFGTIGKETAELIRHGKAGNAKVTAVLVRHSGKLTQLCEHFSEDVLLTDNEQLFFAQRPDLIVECAGHEAVRQYGEKALGGGSHLIVVSVGALADGGLLARLQTAAAEGGRQMYIPSAAIGGLDRIAAASLGELEEVTLVTRKPPRAWKGTPVEKQVNLAELAEPYCVFEGVARDSARLFPESVNVSAALSLAGVGMDATRVSVFVDPGVSHNTHRITARGCFGEIALEVRNTPSPSNPKTGLIVAMSVAKVIKQFTAPVVLGI